MQLVFVKDLKIPTSVPPSQNCEDLAQLNNLSNL